MKYHHLFSDAEAESHWRDQDAMLTDRSFAPPAKAIEVSDPRASSAMIFPRLESGWIEPVHPTLVCLLGAARVTASDGSVGDIGPGDVWLMEDIGGKGHRTVAVSKDDFEAVIVQHA